VNLGSVHLTHHEAGVETLEPYAGLDEEEIVRALTGREAVDGAAVLTTCNRFEVYASGDDGVEARGAILRTVDELADDADPASDPFEKRLGLESVEHLMRVAAGLESMIVGEDQILGQVKDAYERSLDLGAADNDVSLAFKKAIQAGKRVRTETDVDEGAVSVGSAAVTLAERTLGGLEGRSLLVLGAGEMGQLVSKSLADKPLENVVVTSRDVDKAADLADTLDGEAVPYHSYTKALPGVEVVICATDAPHCVLDRSILEEARGGEPDRETLVIDISNPRNVAEDVAEVDDVRLRNLDSLERIAEENRARREKEVERAEDLLYRQLMLVSRQLEERRAEDAIRALHTRMRDVRDREYEQALERMNGVSEDDKEVVHDLVTSALNEMLAPPTLNLKRAAKEGDVETIDALVDLFDLDPHLEEDE
jgi:glutamyl-tRNA reductase